MHTSVVELACHAAMHAPKIVMGDGQGALIAIGYGIPGVLEAALGTRTVQRQEAQEMAEAWGNVTCIIVTSPRMSKTSLGLDKLRAGVPEMFITDSPVPTTKTYGIKVPKAPHYHEGSSSMTVWISLW